MGGERRRRRTRRSSRSRRRAPAVANEPAEDGRKKDDAVDDDDASTVEGGDEPGDFSRLPEAEAALAEAVVDFLRSWPQKVVREEGNGVNDEADTKKHPNLVHLGAD